MEMLYLFMSKVKINKVWQNETEIYQHLYETFIIEKNHKNVDENKVPVFSHSPTGCAIGNLLKSSIAEQLQKYADTFDVYNFLELYQHLQHNYEKKWKGLRETIKLVFNKINKEFLEELQTLHDCVGLTQSGFKTIKLKYRLFEFANKSTNDTMSSSKAKLWKFEGKL